MHKRISEDEFEPIGVRDVCGSIWSLGVGGDLTPWRPSETSGWTVVLDSVDTQATAESIAARATVPDWPVLVTLQVRVTVILAMLR